MEYQLKTRQICFFFIAFLPVIKFFMLPSVLAESSGEDMWISSLINLAFDFLTLLSLIYVAKKTDKDFYTLLKDNFGERVAKTVFFLYAVFFMLKSVLPIIEQKDYIELTLYITMPSLTHFIPFFAVMFYLSLKHLRVLGRLSDIMWIFTVFGYLLLFGLSVSNADFKSILPIGANEFSIVKGAYKSLNWYGDGVYMLFFLGNFKYSKGDGKKLILSFIAVIFSVTVFMITFYSVFTSIAFRQKFALTEISKYSTVINNIGRFDYIGILCIITSNTVSISLPLYFANYTLNKVFPLKKNWIIPLILTLLLFAVVLFLGEYALSIENLSLKYLGAVFFLFSVIIPVLTLTLIKKEKSHACS